jgi:hypothetical protein
MFLDIAFAVVIGFGFHEAWKQSRAGALAFAGGVGLVLFACNLF